MATQHLGSLGRAEGTPVLLEWQWYYNVPGLPVWIVLLLVVVVPSHNRHWQAWLILVLPLLAAAFSLLIETLIPGSDVFGQFVTALAIAWASVWLLAPWLQGGRLARRLLKVCAVMAAVGVVAYLGYFGAWISRDVSWPPIGFWVACSLSLVAATWLTGVVCRRSCSPGRLASWPLLWLLMATTFCVTLVLAVTLPLTIRGGGIGLQETLPAIAMGLVFSVVAACALYVLDLPVLLLRILSPCYRERFRSLFCPGDDGAPTAETFGNLKSQHVTANPFRA